MSGRRDGLPKCGWWYGDVEWLGCPRCNGTDARVECFDDMCHAKGSCIHDVSNGVWSLRRDWSADVVERAIPQAREAVRRKDVASLTPDQQVLYDIIEDRGDVAPGELYDAYRERVADPKTKRTVRNYLQKMRHYNLIEASGENRGRTYRLRSEG